jgi:dienelactone hydrolase
VVATKARLQLDAPAPNEPAVDASAQAEEASLVTLPVRVHDQELALAGAVFWPDAQETPPRGRPVVVFSHPSPLTGVERRAMTPFSSQDAIRWFVDRGYVVVAALRHGFGTSQGAFEEGVAGPDDYAAAGRVAAHDVAAVLAFLRSIAGLDLTRVILAGHSAGGFASLAQLGDEVEGVRVRGALNFAGGKGAQWLSRGAPYTDGLVRAAADYGAKARVPSLWIYADNDLWFAPPIVARMLSAYRAAGAQAEFERVPAFGADGHALFDPEAARAWTAAAERFLASDEISADHSGRRGT